MSTDKSMEDTLSKLQDKVNTITNKNRLGSGSGSGLVSGFGLKYKSSMIYASIPIVIGVILCIMKPTFVMVKSHDNHTYQLSFKKVLIITMLLCMIIGVGIVGCKQYKSIH